MSWTSPLTVASTMVPLPCASDLLHVRLEVGHGRLHHLGALQHERQLHLPGPEQLADGLHARQQRVVDDLQGGSFVERGVEVGLQPVALAVDDPAFQPGEQRQRGQLLGAAGLRRGGGDALEELHEPAQRVVGRARRSFGAAPVVDQVKGHRALLVGNLAHREDLAGVHDRGVEPRVDALVQEHRVQHLPGGGVQPERHVRDAQRRLHLGMAALELPDRLDGLQGVPADLLLPRGDREGEGVDDDVLDVHAVVRGEVSDQRSATRTFHSAVRAWPSSSMHSATTAAPCSRTSAIVRWKRDPGPSPSS